MILEIVLLTFIASTIGTIIGFGISTMMIPVMVLFYPMSITLLFVGLIHLCDDVWKLLLFRAGIRWQLLLTFGISGVVSSILGAFVLQQLMTPIVLKAFGLFLITYVVIVIMHPTFKITYASLTGIMGGSLSGFFAGLFGMGGAIRSAFLLPFDLPKSVYLATAGAISLCIDSVRIATYMINGVRLDQSLLYALLLGVPASLLGAKIGEMVVGKIPEQKFRIVIALFLLGIGLKLVIA